MDLKKFYEVMDADKLKKWLQSSMNDLGLNTLESLKNDKKIEALAKKHTNVFLFFPSVPP